MNQRSSLRPPIVRRCAGVALALLAAWNPPAAEAANGIQADGPDAYAARIAAPQAKPERELDGLDIEALLRKLKVPGVSVAVIRDQRIHWTRAWGQAAAGTALRADAPMQAASISKPVTAMAAMVLVQQGRLDLDRDVNLVLHSWRVPAVEQAQPVTPRALFSHTSGADDGFGFPGYAPDDALPTLPQILDGLPPSPLGPVRFVRPPYRAFKYSGGGTTVAQLAIIDLTGQPFAEFMRRQVLAPLGMADSSFAQPPQAALAARAARAHDREGQPLSPSWHVYPEQAAAGLWTTPADLARFVIEVQQALRGPAGKVLTRESAREMTTPVGVGPYGVGLGLEKRGEGWYFGHGGANWGYRALVRGHLRKGCGLAIMTNGDNGGALIEELAARIERAYGWDSVEQPLKR